VTGWPEGGCLGCSMMADQGAHVAHLNARDTTYARVSRAPPPDIERLKARMGWDVPWYTIADDFDADFGVDELHGTNVFLRDGDRAFRTYFVNHRGDEALGSTWSYLGLTALGARRNGKTRQRDTARPARTSGRRGTTSTGRRPIRERAPRREAGRDQGARAPLGRGRGVIVIAHFAGVPLEALFPTVAGAGSILLLAHSWVSLRLRRHRRCGT
jgi:hypothetical protein